VILAWVPVKKQDNHGAVVSGRLVILRLMCNRISNMHRTRIWIDARDVNQGATAQRELVLNDNLAVPA
jgi:hypothetical protein